MPIIETQKLSFVYSAGTPYEIKAIVDINLSVEQGELVGIIGNTGSGKSTLIQHLNGLLKPTSGSVFFDGRDIWSEPKKIRDIRFKVGLVFQYPEYQLFEETVRKDIAFGPKNMGMTGDELEESVQKAAELVGLSPKLLEKSPFELSGGEKRRAAIAGVIAMNPRVLILDEPTAGLDPVGRDLILRMIKDYRESTGNTVMLVSHSMEDIARTVDRIVVMNKGQIAMQDNVDIIYSRADELINMGLDVPLITRVFMGLKAKGFNVKNNIYTIEQAKAEILAALQLNANREVKL